LGSAKRKKYLASLHHMFDLLATFPKMARERPGFAPAGLRVHRHGRHYIAYIVEPDRVVVLRVVRDDADLDRLFGKLE
jgi:toxin ParE1/3/4